MNNQYDVYLCRNRLTEEQQQRLDNAERWVDECIQRGKPAFIHIAQMHLWCVKKNIGLIGDDVPAPKDEFLESCKKALNERVLYTWRPTENPDSVEWVVNGEKK